MSFSSSNSSRSGPVLVNSNSNSSSSSSNKRAVIPRNTVVLSTATVPLGQQTTQCVQHDDLIKYIFDSWCKISQEFERNSSSSGSGGASSQANNTVAFYKEQENEKLRDFEPFDLEAYWGRKFVNNVHTTVEEDS